MITLTTEQAQQIEVALDNVINDWVAPDDFPFEDGEMPALDGARNALATIRAARAQDQAEQDLDTCPGCGGVADNGHDREFPPNPYYCTKCSEQAEQEPVLYPVRRGSRITCVESGEKCVVWTTSDTHAWVQFPDGFMGEYTYEQIGAFFSLDDNYATDEAYERGLKEGIEAGKKIAAFEAKQEPVVDSIKIGSIPPFPLHTSTVQQVEQEPLTIEAAEKMGATGAEPTETERQLFEAWMKGHCWAVCGKWDGKQYVGTDAYDDLHPYVMHTRGLWAAWRDRAALAAPQPMQEPVAFHRASFLSGYEAAQSDANSCDVPPQGWLCTRQAGHDGPCAAIADDKERELVNRAMLRLADQEAAPVQLVKQKPVAYMVKSEGFIYSLVNRISAAEEIVSMLRKDDQGAAIHPLYAAPVQQVDLTDEELEALYDRHAGGWRVLFRAVIAADREKNRG